MSDMRPIEQVDPLLAGLIKKEVDRQRSQIHLIASENYISMAMMQSQEPANAGLDELLREPPLSTLMALEPESDNPIEFVTLPLAESAEPPT